MMNVYEWPYPNEFGVRETVESDLLVLGGGLAGCFAAIAAARRGQRVVLVEKGATERSGSAGSGFDHWESACSNPCSRVTPKEIAEAYVEEQDGYSNGIAHYIECREGYDRLLDLEDFGGKIRDSEGEFAGAEFRDEKTGLLFAYDYQNRFTLLPGASAAGRAGLRPRGGNGAAYEGGGRKEAGRRRRGHERAHGKAHDLQGEGHGPRHVAPGAGLALQSGPGGPV